MPASSGPSDVVSMSPIEQLITTQPFIGILHFSQVYKIVLSPTKTQSFLKVGLFFPGISYLF